ncbi:hypothetical protein SAMN00017405_1005 [Desulfonispora thiosulfatigenes DSM 11270]|uniref:SIMPL domain-containing protein n=1 Tax=Desulfonispora thiosulfatigenes DSM 11270 TaxID=656914 RepID=A0A1W1UPY8_DESTI|nr:SIMPL domain-containing protein [Desulfonispora thiosulfatigenes]SMB83136.1 hypothetical protein SAMN00017405_1005 [Desulfonispora thiosulfatigenes DSM 11270]
MKICRKLLLLIMLVLSMAMFTGFASEESVKDLSTVDVVGTGKISADPDLVSIRFEVSTEGKSKNIMDETSAKTKKVINLLENSGIDKKEIKTENINFYPLTRWNNDLEQEENTGYRATNYIIVTTKNLAKTGEIIDIAIKNGAESMSGVEFILSETGQQKLLNEAIVKAINDAKAQAKMVTTAIGSQIVKIKNIEVQKNFNSYPVFMTNEMSKAEDSSIPIEPQNIEYQVMVKITYIIK